MKNRIEEKLENLQKAGKKAFITYMTAGLPDMDATKKLLKAQEEAGTDIVELGIPFSDPVADGPVIQNASYQAILRGSSLRKTFTAVKEARTDCQIPIVFMMYYNTILHYGVKEFVEKCAETGVDGLIIPDLPFEEQDELKQYLDKENAPILIQLVSPVSKQRVPMILENARGFVYCVSSMGVTGQQGGFYSTVSDYLKEVKAQSKIPVMMGFGIKDASDVEFVKDTIDGCIVGTHFVQLLMDSDYNLDAAKEYISTFKKELNGEAVVKAAELQ